MIEITTNHSRSSDGIPVILRDGEILNDFDPASEGTSIVPHLFSWSSCYVKGGRSGR